jgi:aspartate oxidase
VGEGLPVWQSIGLVRQAFQLSRCGCTLRVTSQTSYSPEYITPTHTKMSYVCDVALSVSTSAKNQQQRETSTNQHTQTCQPQSGRNRELYFTKSKCEKAN